MPEVNAFLWVNDPAAERSAFNPVFNRSEATEMNNANAQQASRSANTVFHEFTWGPVEVRDGVFVVAGKKKGKA